MLLRVGGRPAGRTLIPLFGRSPSDLADLRRELLCAADSAFWEAWRSVGHWLRDYEVLRGAAERLRGQPVEFRVVSPRVDGLAELPNVTVRTGLSDDALRDLYRDSDLLVLPLTTSTANCALVEGMASGLPVVATDLPSVRAYVPEGGALLVPGSDPDALAAAIRRLVRDPAARRAMGRRDRARAEELSWRRLMPWYEALYSRLAVPRRARTIRSAPVSSDSTRA